MAYLPKIFLQGLGTGFFLCLSCVTIIVRQEISLAPLIVAALGFALMWFGLKNCERLPINDKIIRA